MIAYLRGAIHSKSSVLKKDGFVVIDVNGVGYKVYVLNKFLNNAVIGQEAQLFIYTQVAETALDLYGFAEKEGLEFFELLITLQGIGPRSALDILQKAKVEDLRQGILTGNHEVLSKISGIGPKTAEKVVTGLKNKIGGLEQTAAQQSWNDSFGDALEALISLGYQAGQAREVLSQIKSEDTSERIKEALKILGRK